MISTRSTLAVLVIAAGAVPNLATTTAAADRGTFVTTLGRDTVVLESFAQTSTRLEGDIVVRIPGTVQLHYSVDMAPDGAPVHSVVDVIPLGTNQVSPHRVTLDFARDSLTVDFDSAGHHSRSRVALAGPIVAQLMTGFGPSYGLYTSPALYESYPAIAHANVGDTLRLTAVDVASGRAVKRTFVKRSPTVLDADYFGIGWTRLRVDEGGRIMAADASRTTEQTQMSRTQFIDLHATAERYAALDRAGKGIGLASPDVIARGKIDGQLVVVTYGSPRLRNREILGGVVPFDNVWRTGANEATVIYFDRTVNIGGTSVPAGTYSLWTLPKRDGTVDLIINSQHGQWGTDYDKSHDLFRIPMGVSKAASPQENFTITVAEGRTGALTMSWDHFIWSVPVSVAS